MFEQINDPVANHTVDVVRMRLTKLHLKSMRSGIPEGITSFFERRKD